MPAVTAENLTKRFGGLTALDGATFTAGRGELFGVIGPDGAGKTTLMRLLVTLSRPDAGRATVLGFDVVRKYAEVRRRVGYMPGRFALYPDLTVAENLAFFAALFRTDPSAGRDLIAPIYGPLERFASRPAGKLSGGMKQKLALSCALVHRPAVLFLDEPTTGVDPISRREFWTILGQLRSRGMTIMVSTPYMDEAARCDRIALCHGGRLIGIDTPDGLCRSFGTELFGLSASGDRHALLLATRHYGPTKSCYAFGAELHLTFHDRPDPDGLRVHLAREGFADARLRPIAPGVEDCFMKMTDRHD